MPLCDFRPMFSLFANWNVTSTLVASPWPAHLQSLRLERRAGDAFDLVIAFGLPTLNEIA